MYMQVSLLRQGRASGRLVVLVQALTTPTLVAAAAADSQPAGSFVQGTDVPAVIQVQLMSPYSCHVIIKGDRHVCCSGSGQCNAV